MYINVLIFEIVSVETIFLLSKQELEILDDPKQNLENKGLEKSHI